MHCLEEKKNGRNRKGDNDLRDEADQGCIESVCEDDRDSLVVGMNILCGVISLGCGVVDLVGKM